MAKIRVHEKALGHLTRGLYRSPASALRELVSNAWDANARVVKISTNHPIFLQMAISDDGDGFSKDEFIRIMRGGIGNSTKPEQEVPLKFGRPRIGRLGIGMLGIAQICGSFEIESRTRTGETFRARVTLTELMRASIDDPKSGLVERISSDDSEPITYVDIGEYNLLSGEPSFEGHGTRIFTDDLHPTFSLTFQNSLTGENSQPVGRPWSDSARTVLPKVRSLQLLGDYWRLLFELAVSCPIPYIDDAAIPRRLIRDYNQELERYQFRLLVDGLELRKPIYLPDQAVPYTSMPLPETEQRVYGRNLKFSGYIAVQNAKQIQPDELRGILVRIKNIGVGVYDGSLLDFRRNEGPRSRWVTGEIFVHEGLDDALNIDRDSFNKFHPEYRVLQEVVHNFLSDEIFPDVYEKIEERTREREKIRTRARRKSLVSAIQTVTNRTVTISAPRPDVEEVTVKSTNRGKSLEITQASEDTLRGVPKRSRQLAQGILAIYEVSLLQVGLAKRRAEFERLLVELLKKW